MLFKVLSVLLATTFGATNEDCKWSPTTVSGSKKPTTVCSGQLIFEDNFDSFDQTKWQHRVTLSGGRISEQVYLLLI
jgi:hypothetical protein